MRTHLITLMLAMLPVLTYATEERSNLLADPGFEQTAPGETLRSWLPNPVAEPDLLELNVDHPREIRNGVASLHLVFQGGTDRRGAVFSHALLPVQPEVDYTLACWVKGDGLVELGVYPYQNGQNASHVSDYTLVREDGEEFPFSINDPNQWQEVRYTFRLTNPETTINQIRYVILAYGDLYIDDCSFSPNRTHL